ncbi:MAG: hypothetical protein KMY55_09895 [Dethiosulfatibacter sp.]|nr:hypothetical protein [Dethiosulfatibacter sp.]
MYTPIELDKTRNLRYGFKALSLIEKRLGKNLAKIDFDNITIEQLMTIVWAGLVHEDNTLTVDKLIDIVDDKNIKFDTITTAMTEAISEAFGNPKQAVADQESLTE